MSKNNQAYFPIILLVLAFATDLLTPFFIVRGRIPPSLRWISHAVIALVIFWVILRMLAYNRFPRAVWVVVMITAFGLIAAVLNGQGLPETLWGWWLMFQFPMIGLFTYLQTDWPKHFSKMLIIGCVALLGCEVLVQIYQYLRGTIPGDHLAGTFGNNGTGNLVLFILLVLSFTFGEWLATRNWIPLVLALGFGAISSTFGEMKIFIPAVVLLGMIALGIYLSQAKELWKLLPYGFVLSIALVVFLMAYNAVVPAAGKLPLEKFLSNPKYLLSYMDSSSKFVSAQIVYTDMGRNFALQYGWNQIKDDPMRLLVGIGLGTRAESSSLGVTGRGLIEGGIGIATGSSLLVMMQEIGLLGLAIVSGFFLVIVFKLYQQIRTLPGVESNGLRYGLILFTLLWPFWLWYNTAWVLRVPMILYWGVLGYVMGEATSILAMQVRNRKNIISYHPSNLVQGGQW